MAGIKRIICGASPEYKITRGFIHTFKYLDNIKGREYAIYSEIPSWLHIFKCIIPKGSIYFKGTFETESQDRSQQTYISYASPEIIYKEKINL